MWGRALRRLWLISEERHVPFRENHNSSDHHFGLGRQEETMKTDLNTILDLAIKVIEAVKETVADEPNQPKKMPGKERTDEHDPE